MSLYRSFIGTNRTLPEAAARIKGFGVNSTTQMVVRIRSLRRVDKEGAKVRGMVRAISNACAGYFSGWPDHPTHLEPSLGERRQRISQIQKKNAIPGR